MSDVPKKAPGLIQRTLNKVLNLGEIAVHQAGKMYDELQWKLHGFDLGPEMRTGAEAGQTIMMRELEHKLRRYQNIEDNMALQGIPDTVPDVWPEPLTQEQSDRWNAYLKTQEAIGVGRDEAIEKFRKKQIKERGYATSIVPASDPIISVHDLDPRDPYRDPRLLREFEKTPGSLGQDVAMMAGGVYTPPTTLWKQDNADRFYEVPLPAKKEAKSDGQDSTRKKGGRSE